LNPEQKVAKESTVIRCKKKLEVHLNRKTNLSDSTK
jgi:hypothetical protein